MGSLVGGVSLILPSPKDDTDADEFNTRMSGLVDSGVRRFFGFDFDAFGAFKEGLDAFDFAGVASGPLDSHPIRLFCFMFSVDGFAFGGMVSDRDEEQIKRRVDAIYLCSGGAHNLPSRAHINMRMETHPAYCSANNHPKSRNRFTKYVHSIFIPEFAYLFTLLSPARTSTLSPMSRHAFLLLLFYDTLKRPTLQ